MRNVFSIGFLAGVLCCTPAAGREGDRQRLEDYLKAEFAYVIDLQGFYIAGTDERPLHTSPGPVSAREAVVYAADIFAAMLDQNEDSKIDNPRLLNSLKKHLVFGVGYARTLEKHEEFTERNLGHYMMSMKSDVWDIRYDFGKYEIASGERLNASGWRPPNAGSIREEAYHTITEAMNRYDPNWSFKPGSKLHGWMDGDRRRGLYDTEIQNAAEDGQYDDATAVNELIHQVWIFNQAGGAGRLTANQKNILNLIKSAGLDLNVNDRYDGRRLYRVYTCTRGECATERERR
ncbi:MAG: hypothetical protein RIF32_01420 [Leptospirales bacterium]|jgi:hypothetical protein